MPAPSSSPRFLSAHWHKAICGSASALAIPGDRLRKAPPALPPVLPPLLPPDAAPSASVLKRSVLSRRHQPVSAPLVFVLPSDASRAPALWPSVGLWTRLAPSVAARKIAPSCSAPSTDQTAATPACMITDS